MVHMCTNQKAQVIARNVVSSHLKERMLSSDGNLLDNSAVPMIQPNRDIDHKILHLIPPPPVPTR